MIQLPVRERSVSMLLLRHYWSTAKLCNKIAKLRQTRAFNDSALKFSPGTDISAAVALKAGEK